MIDNQTNLDKIRSRILDIREDGHNFVQALKMLSKEGYRLDSKTIGLLKAEEFEKLVNNFVENVDNSKLPFANLKKVIQYFAEKSGIEWQKTLGQHLAENKSIPLMLSGTSGTIGYTTLASGSLQSGDNIWVQIGAALFATEQATEVLLGAYSKHQEHSKKSGAIENTASKKMDMASTFKVLSGALIIANVMSSFGYFLSDRPDMGVRRLISASGGVGMLGYSFYYDKRTNHGKIPLSSFNNLEQTIFKSAPMLFGAMLAASGAELAVAGDNKAEHIAGSLIVGNYAMFSLLGMFAGSKVVSNHAGIAKIVANAYYGAVQGANDKPIEEQIEQIVKLVPGSLQVGDWRARVSANLLKNREEKFVINRKGQLQNPENLNYQYLEVLGAVGAVTNKNKTTFEFDGDSVPDNIKKAVLENGSKNTIINDNKIHFLTNDALENIVHTLSGNSINQDAIQR